MLTPLTLTSAAVAAGVIGLVHFVVEPARRRRRERRARELAEQVQQARTQAVGLTVDLLYARNPHLWDEFAAAHGDLPRGGAR